MKVNLGWSDFARRLSRKEEGNSYTDLSEDEVIALVQSHWGFRRPGQGETELHRKVLVPIYALETLQPKGFYCPPRMSLKLGMPVHAEVSVRQEGEDPHVQTFITPADAEKWGWQPTPATHVDIVCYSAEALLENNGKRSGEWDWEIVTLLCTTGETEPMQPIAMARNQLEKNGGTRSFYSSDEFANAIWFWSQRGIRIKEPSQPKEPSHS